MTALLTGPTDKTDDALFEHDDEENLDPMADEAEDTGEDEYRAIYAEDSEPFYY